MATQRTQAAGRQNKNSILSKDKIDAIELLTQDHQNVKDLFEQYESLSDRAFASKKARTKNLS